MNGFNFEMYSGECRAISPTLQRDRSADTLVYKGKTDGDDDNR